MMLGQYTNITMQNIIGMKPTIQYYMTMLSFPLGTVTSKGQAMMLSLCNYMVIYNHNEACN